jgi:hypothetical protein
LGGGGVPAALADADGDPVDDAVGTSIVAVGAGEPDADPEMYVKVADEDAPEEGDDEGEPGAERVAVGVAGGAVREPEGAPEGEAEPEREGDGEAEEETVAVLTWSMTHTPPSE